MNSIEKEAFSLINNFSLNFKNFEEVDYANAFDDRRNTNGIDVVFQGISIVLKDSLLNEKDIDLFEFCIDYRNRKDDYIHIEEIDFCTSDGNLYLEFIGRLLFFNILAIHSLEGKLCLFSPLTLNK